MSVIFSQEGFETLNAPPSSDHQQESTAILSETVKLTSSP